MGEDRARTLTPHAALVALASLARLTDRLKKAYSWQPRILVR
jgi:hypothetical protein